MGKYLSEPKKRHQNNFWVKTTIQVLFCLCIFNPKMINLYYYLSYYLFLLCIFIPLHLFHYFASWLPVFSYCHKKALYRTLKLFLNLFTNLLQYFLTILSRWKITIFLVTIQHQSGSFSLTNIFQWSFGNSESGVWRGIALIC